MTDIPRVVVTARRTAGAILVVSALATIVALVLVFAWWFTLAPTVRAVAGPSGSVPSYSVQIPAAVPATPTDPGAVLAQQAANDQATVATIPEGYWVPQLSSKRIGTVDDGKTYTEQDIVDDHLELRSQYPGAVLLWSGDYPTFTLPDLWVTILPSDYHSGPAGANAWCDASGRDKDHCFAKRISSTSRYGHNTEHRR